ncbi:YMGG-like glycine zipper-containing protein [Roseomonas sp. USHLN139]|uniref:YMGG-like glycine zipper-containing protein n=1 Tax=Roseomonas sp. USHLN139 TaxID=3081298 RepID=UPI003B016F6E
MRKTSIALLALASIGLGACGYSTGDRAASGGLLGAGAGAAVGSLSGNAGAGALIGGAAGALGGAVTGPNTVNLGRPAWR